MCSTPATGHCLGRGLPGAASHLVEGMTRDSVLVIRPLGGSFSVNRSRAEVSTSGLSSGGAGCSPGAGVLCGQRMEPWGTRAHGVSSGTVLPCLRSLGLGEGAQASPGLVTPCMWTWPHAALGSQLTSTSNHRAPGLWGDPHHPHPAPPFLENPHENSRKQP